MELYIYIYIYIWNVVMLTFQVSPHYFCVCNFVVRGVGARVRYTCLN
jgi:hypothetical protein